MPEESSRTPRAPLIVGIALVVLAVMSFVWRAMDQAATPEAQTSPASAAPASAAPASAATTAEKARPPAPLKLTAPPALLRKHDDAPLETSRGGEATVVGRMIRLDAGREAIGDARQVCLTDEAGATDTCAVLDGWPSKRVICSRAHVDAPMKGTIRWQVPCP
ncbi:MAG: hypothetical protein R3F60_07935 [bacterium]